MNYSDIKELMGLFDQSDIREFDIKFDNLELYMSKNSQSQSCQKSCENEKSSVVPESMEVNKPEVQPSSSIVQEPVASPVKEKAAGKTVNSPIVGVAYLSSAPDKPVYKKVGDSVEIGETLCIVEAMKVMNEIVSDIAGTVTEILIENEEVVEYGQPLFRIV